MSTILDTASVRLDIPLHPISILSLSTTGLMPDVPTEPGRKEEPRFHQAQHLPPRNRTERQLLSVWLNTHQAMFMTIAMGNYAIARAIRALERRDLPAILEWLGFARDARQASAAYTDLPALTQPLYEAYIRESMKGVHPGFSGVSNLESIVMERSLRQLKSAVLACGATDRQFAQQLAGATQEVAEADQFWWRSHGQAMRRMVLKPVSLARLDFQHKSTESDDMSKFEEYRERILREPKALTEYDAYFAVERRGDWTLGEWQRNLTGCLARADDYVNQHGTSAARWRPVRPRLFHLIERAAA